MGACRRESSRQGRCRLQEKVWEAQIRAAAATTRNLGQARGQRLNMPELKKPIGGSEKSFPCLVRVFMTRGGRLSNPGQHGGREHPTRDAGIPCMHARTGSKKDPSDRVHGPARWISHPPKMFAGFFFGPSLDL